MNYEIYTQVHSLGEYFFSEIPFFCIQTFLIFQNFLQKVFTTLITLNHLRHKSAFDYTQLIQRTVPYFVRGSITAPTTGLQFDQKGFYHFLHMLKLLNRNRSNWRPAVRTVVDVIKLFLEEIQISPKLRNGKKLFLMSEPALKYENNASFKQI